MTILFRTLLSVFTLAIAASPSLVAVAQTVSQNQQLGVVGLLSVAEQGQFNGVATDGAGNLYLLLNAQDGVRLVKTDNGAVHVLAQAKIGAKGDIGVGVALDPLGNVYVTGTTTSTTLNGTNGSAFPNRTDSSTNSFVAKFDTNLDTIFVTFTGGSRIAATAVTATADSVFVTGSLFSATLPVTATAIQQAPAYNSSQNGFVERFSSDGSTLVYATYLTGAGGNTAPTSIAADTADDAYIVGNTSAPGYPTIAAVVPAVLGANSGFLTKLNPAGSGITFSTYVPGNGLTSVALNGTGSTLLLAGSVALGQFPVDTVAVPVLPAATTNYQVLVRMPVNGSGVLTSTLLVPGSASYVASDAAGAIWVDGVVTEPFFPIAPLAGFGQGFAARLNAANAVDETARFGGLANGNSTYASAPVTLTSVAVDASGEALLAGGIAPGASASLLATATVPATQTFDVPVFASPTAVLPSGVANAMLTAAQCNGSLCAGGAGYLAKLIGTGAPSLSFSAEAAPLVVLRNLGSVAATGVQVSGSGFSVTTNCGSTLYAGAECYALLTGGGAGTLTASASNAATQTAAIPAFAAAATTIVFSPKEIDFGIATSTSAATQRVITVTNLGQQSENFLSALDVASNTSISGTGKATASDFSQISTDCTATTTANTYVLAAGGVCHITVGFTAGSAGGGDGFEQAEWAIGALGAADVLLTGYQQALSLGVSASEVDFGTEYEGGLRLPRYVYLSNSSTAAVAHAAIALKAGSPFTVTDHCPDTLAPGSVCQIRIDYLSTNFPSSDTTTLTLDDGLTVLVTGESLPQPGVNGSAVNPNLTVTPASVNFANAVAVTGVSGATQTVTIGNQGASAFSLAVELAGDFTETTNCGATLAGGASCSVILSFAPSQPGVRDGLLSVTAGSGTTPAYVALSGTGTAILPANNGTLNQGSVPVGEPSVMWYKVAQPISALTAAATGEFTVVLVQDIGYGHGQPATTAFAATATGSCANCWLGVQFLPTSTGTQTGVLTLTSAVGGNPYTLALTGIGLPLTGLLLTPLAADFGVVPVGSSSGTTLFTATNLAASGAAITLAAPVTTGDFGVSTAVSGGPACGGALAYGASCFVQVVMTPTAIGAETGSLTVSGGGLSATAALTGYAPADPGVGLNPTVLTFNNVPGASAGRQTVTLTNLTGSAITVGTATVGTASFTASSGCGTVAAGASCAISVVYMAGTATVSDTLTIPVTQTTGGNPPAVVVYRVPLNGAYTSTDAGLQIVPMQTEFGPVTVETAGIARQFTVNNLSANAVSLAVSIPQQFALIGPACTALAANGSCSFSAAFVPMTNGDTPGTLVASGSGGLQGIGYVEGYGIGSAVLTISGNVLPGNIVSFGQVASGQSGTQTLTLTNAGAASLTVRGIVSQPPFLSSSTCGSAMAMGASCTITVTYSPVNQVASGTAASNTIDSGTLTIVSDAQTSPNTLLLSGQGGPVFVSSPSNITPVATYSVSQGSLTFPATNVGNVSAAQTVTLTNTGTATIQILSAMTTTDFTVQNGCGMLVPGATCTLSVTATPQTAGQHMAALEIASTAGASLGFVSLISGGGSATLVITPGSLNFGSVLVGKTSAAQTLTVTNSGTAGVVFNGITVSGNYGATSTCPAPGGTLAAGASCTIAVTFSPATTGTLTGTVQVANSASTLPLKTPLTGVGVVPELLVTPTTLSFGNVAVGTTGSATLTLTNQGTTAITGIVLTVTGNFAVTVPCTTALAAGASCTVQMTFTPTAIGTATGTLTIASSDPGSPATVALTGMGTTATGFTLTVDGGAAASVSVNSGLPATYTLTLTPVNGYTGTVALTCTPVIAAEYASCSLLPSTMILAGGNVSGTATINTLTSVSSAVDRPQMSRRTKIILAFLVPGMFGVWRARRRVRNKIPLLLGLFLFVTILFLSGCGGSSPSKIRYAPAGTYQYQVTASSTSGMPISQTVTLNLTVN